jgi:endonuclease III
VTRSLFACTLEELMTLPGVGRKTANMVLGGTSGLPSIAVDTMVARLARQPGWAGR